MDPGQLAALAEVVEVVVVEEELGADVVGAGIDLGLQIVHLVQPVRRVGMPFREPSDADAEAAPVGMRAALVQPADEAHQVGRMLERIGLAVVVLRRRAADRPRARGCCSLPACRILRQDLLDLRLAVADAGQVRDRVERGGLLQPQHQIVGQLPRRAAGAVGHRDERGLQRLQVGDVLVKRLGVGLGLGREELERDRGLVGGEDVVNMHWGQYTGCRQWQGERLPGWDAGSGSMSAW